MILGFMFLLPYFFGCKSELFSFQNNPKKSRFVLWDGFRSLGLFKNCRTRNIAKLHRTA